MNLVNEAEVRQMALVEYQSFLSSSNMISPFDPRSKQIKEIGAKLSKACEEFLQENGSGERVAGYQWEFNLVEEDIVNAWCMPGGKVVFYTGILPICEDENGIATVMSHEIAHAVARHGNERLSQALIQQTGAAALDIALSQQEETTRYLAQMSFGLTSNLGLLAYSRTHELEADKMGLVFMARAGYNLNEAVGFWERMSKQGGGAPPEMLSTHPSDARRIQEIREFIPVAESIALF